MTEEEFSGLFDAEEQALLGELGTTLKATPALELPVDFARQTARAAEERFQRLPALSKLAVRLEPVLGAPVASARAFPFTLGLLGGTVLGGVLGQPAIADLGLGLLAMVLVWKLLARMCLPRTGPRRELIWLAPEPVFYLLPIASAVASAIFCGGVVSSLGLFSINFKAASWNTVLLGPAAGLAVFLFLLSALMPSWNALQRQCIGRPRWIFPVQYLHAAWVGVLVSLLVFVYDPKISGLRVWGPVLLLAGLISWILGFRPLLEKEGRPALWRALHKTGRSLILGGLPVGAVLVCAYEAALTRQIEQPQVYQSTMTEVSDWVQAQNTIPPEQNGWSLVRTAMTRGSGAPIELAEQMRAGGQLWEPSHNERYWEMPGSKVKWRKAHQDFLKALPTVRASLARPYFSSISSQGFKMQSLAPNYLLARSTSQGLTALTLEAIQNHQAEQALDYQLTNLAWSKAFREGSLISLMISVAQESIAVENVERWVFETHPSADQLRRLLAGLQTSGFERRDLQSNMKREIYLADHAFSELLEKDPAMAKQLDANTEQGGWQLLLKILPRSYWRSEHNAYLNLMLANQDNLFELGRPNEIDPSQLLPFSFAARQLAPLTFRAQAQFMVSLTRFGALKTVLALEIYQREHGAYPESLDQLVPRYLQELPKDAVSPKLWARKPGLSYQRREQGYELVSQSPVYETVHFKSRQLYGPDGNYKLEEYKP